MFSDLQSQGDVSLGRTATLVNVNAIYFSELFRKTTGIKLVDYVSRVRVEKAPPNRKKRAVFPMGCVANSPASLMLELE